MRGRREAGQLAFEGGDAGVETFQDFPRVFGEDGALGAVMARGGAAFDGILKFLAARAAGARALAGGEWGGHGLMCVDELAIFLS